ncbi:MAG: nucleotide sugar dehydrogenase [Pseudomonadota bacterium]
MADLDDARLAVVGLGYVGLPLAVEFGKVRPVIGFDVCEDRINGLRAGVDATREVGADDLAAAEKLTFTSDIGLLAQGEVFVVAVPTPVDDAQRPDLKFLISASETVGWAMKKGAVVIYESTVFPGCTEQVCVPILERTSGLKYNEDFFVGYSPERANPGDKAHRLTTITKVTAGSTPEIADAVDRLYGSIITAGTHKAGSIEVAEAAKVIENIQRDINIALMNELAMIFHKLGLDSKEVLQAAGTKWNFLPFKPGLVGGHCIGVDPYYLTHRAQQVGYHPEIILAGRRINDGMGRFVVERTMRLMLRRGFPVVGSRVLVMGLTFKENCPDLRNSRVIDIIDEFKGFNAEVDVWDPWVTPEEARAEYGITLLTEQPAYGVYDAVVVAVAHSDFAKLGATEVRRLARPHAVVFDVKGVFAKDLSDGRL